MYISSECKMNFKVFTTHIKEPMKLFLGIDLTFKWGRSKYNIYNTLTSLPDLILAVELLSHLKRHTDGILILYSFAVNIKKQMVLL